MRTTLTLDEDVASKLKAEAQRGRRTFRETVNDVLRRGLESRRAASARSPFEVRARDLGELRPGLTLDSVSDLLDRVEGPQHR